LWPTRDAAANDLILRLLEGVRDALGEQFVGMYLYGSIATGDFRPGMSDIDFLVAVQDELSPRLLTALRRLHARLAAGPSPWAQELEGSYIPVGALRRYDASNAIHPRVERGGGLLEVRGHGCDWVIQRLILRERGVVLSGPPPADLIDPVSVGEFRDALRQLMREWWAPMCAEPFRLRGRGYRAYAVLTMCRVLYSLESGTVVSKPVAARWAPPLLDERARALVDWALSGDWAGEDDDYGATIDLIRFTFMRSEASAFGSP
jgi:predicted nucleotidyltransferase